VWHYQQALTLRPSRIMVHVDLAWTLAKQGRLSEAADHYRLVLAHYPTIMSVRTNLASVLLADGRLSEAIEVLGQAAVVSPPDEVVAFLTDALAARPDDPSLRLGLLQAYLAAGRIDLARAQHEALRQRQPLLATAVAPLFPALVSR